MRIVAPVLCALIAASCSAIAPAPDARDGAPSPRTAGLLEPVDGQDDSSSRLAVEVRDVRIVQGRAIRVRGNVTNPYALEVEGVRYRLRLLSTDGSRILSTEYEELETFVAAGSTAGYELELESVYFATVPRFLIDAVPRKLGGQSFDAPATWAR